MAAELWTPILRMKVVHSSQHLSVRNFMMQDSQ